MFEKDQTKQKRNWKKRSHFFLVRKQKRRAEKILRNRRRRHSYYSVVQHYSENRNVLSKEDALAKEFNGYYQVPAPSNFSLVNNEKRTLEFLHNLRECLSERKKVLVRLDDVRILSTEAILVLLSNMVHFKVEKVDFNGTRPQDVAVRTKLESSGFFNQLYGIRPDEDQYVFKKMSSMLYTHGQKTVASEDADRIVKYASETVWGEPRRCPGVQKTLLELMHNTHDHAGETKGEKHWWLSVEHKTMEHEVVFSFIDFGVGIFRSLENKGPDEPLAGALEYIKKLFPNAKTQVEKLTLILEGKVKLTQTNEYYRGKGLAKIYNMYKRNMISSLSIISNHASINADTSDAHVVSDEFVGTFISFKINQNTYSLPWEI